MDITIKCEGLTKEEVFVIEKELQLIMRKRKRSNKPRFRYVVKVDT